MNREDSRPRIIFLMGPTASGKTALAVVEKGKTVHVEDESEEDRLRRLLEALDPSDSGGYTM